MALAYNRHELKIQQIFNDFNDGVLIVDTSYQRRSIWLERDKVRLIETILMGLIIPEVYFWDAETDPDTGKTITHIVDGQQRINAIAQFINNEFKLSKDFLIDQDISERYGNKYFCDLTNEDKILIWTFNLSVVRIKDKNVDMQDPKNHYHYNIEINPKIIRKFKIESVPAVVYVQGYNQALQEATEIPKETGGERYYIAYGNVAVDYALQKINQEARSKSLENLIKNMENSFFK